MDTYPTSYYNPQGIDIARFQSMPRFDTLDTAALDLYTQSCIWPSNQNDDAIFSWLASPEFSMSLPEESPLSASESSSRTLTPPESPSSDMSSLATSLLLPPQDVTPFCFDDLTKALTQPPPMYHSDIFYPRTDNTKLDTYFQAPHQKQLRELLEKVVNSTWYLENEKEPEDHSKRSILSRFLERSEKGNAYTCQFDGCGKIFDRQDRALGHVRMHLEHRPFVCGGHCGAYDCRERFFCTSYLSSHTKRPKEHCKKCDKSFHKQQMRRHSVTCTGPSSHLNPMFSYYAPY